MPRSSLRTRIEKRAGGRCEYCQAPQHVCGYHFHLEHIVPISLNGSSQDDNRALACASCNLAKSDRISGVDPLTEQETALFHPRVQIWQEHFQWAEDRRTLTGLTSTGRATIVALDMNSELRQEARNLWFLLGLLPHPTER